MSHTSFEVVAGKYEDGCEENIKYLNSFEHLAEAVDCVKANKLTSYHFCRIEKFVSGKRVMVYS